MRVLQGVIILMAVLMSTSIAATEDTWFQAKELSGKAFGGTYASRSSFLRGTAKNCKVRILKPHGSVEGREIWVRMDIDAQTSRGEHPSGYFYFFTIGGARLDSPFDKALGWQHVSRKGDQVLLMTMDAQYVGAPTGYCGTTIPYYDNTLVELTVSEDWTQLGEMHIVVRRTYTPFMSMLIEERQRLDPLRPEDDELFIKDRIGLPVRIMDMRCNGWTPVTDTPAQ